MTRRLDLTLLGFVAVLVSMLGLVPFVLAITSLGLVVVWIGLPMLLVSVLLLRAFATPFRHWAGRVTGQEVVTPYRAPGGSGLFARVRGVLTDPATWRDLLWVLVNATAGFTLALLPVAFLLSAVFYLVYPLLLAVTPYGVFNDPMGPLFTLDPWWEGFAMLPVALVVLGVWWVTTPPILRGWAALHTALLGPSRTAVLQGRVAVLTTTRADTVDTAAAEIRRIERDLHDGAQVRLVSLGMTLGLAGELMQTDPDRARALVAEATAATSTALQELRSLVRGIHPPVLADRGLVGAVHALALDTTLPVEVGVSGFGASNERRLDAPVEACGYFAVAEALANVIKHADATSATVSLRWHADRLLITVDDDGHGGARVTDAGGLGGLRRRLAAFDGTLEVTSPAGGPTRLTMEIPCALLSPKTTPSSVTA